MSSRKPRRRMFLKVIKPVGGKKTEPTKKENITDGAAKLAKANKVSLNKVVATGKDGKIIVGDVKRYLKQATSK